jgi:hypothetical protein
LQYNQQRCQLIVTFTGNLQYPFNPSINQSINQSIDRINQSIN